MASKSVTWWKIHRNSPGMDRASKWALLDVLEAEDARLSTVREGLSGDMLVEWDAMFSSEDAERRRIIDEIGETLKTSA